jgi:hypothetical protein
MNEINPSFARNTINALLQILERRKMLHHISAAELRKASEMIDSGTAPPFGYLWRIANGAVFLAELSGTSPSLRTALLSLAHLGYEYCSRSDERFGGSLQKVNVLLKSQRFNQDQILAEFRTFLVSDPSPSVEAEGNQQITEAPITATIDSAIPEAETFDVDRPIASGYMETAFTFQAPPQLSFRERFEELLTEFPTSDDASDDLARQSAIDSFRDLIATVMRVADRGRTFTEFPRLDDDLTGVIPYLQKLVPSKDPRQNLEFAKLSRGLAKSVDFRSSSPDDFRFARYSWLLACYWNSVLIASWSTNRPNAVFDFIGYLNIIQAEIRYTDSQLLLLLRVGFSICRVCSEEALIPLQYLRAESDELRDWIRYTVGTLLVSVGPGRVAPSRVPYDTRLGPDRRSHATTLLASWRSPEERAAASIMLLEMGGWEARRAHRLVEQAVGRDVDSAEIWKNQIDAITSSLDRVRVVRPNPWQPGSNKPLTVEREAVAVLAADVREHHYSAIGGDITLLGHFFHARRVPTFVCSAEYGPLGLFKLDAADRIEREVRSFAKYAQRLHPRFRASRCDCSTAVVTEPDDNKQFVQGLLTSYVFTEDETPRTLNSWLGTASEHAADTLFRTLFGTALQPWYGHAASGTIDIFSEFPVFSTDAVDRLISECKIHHGIEIEVERVSSDSPGSLSVGWITSLLKSLSKSGESFDTFAVTASELQVLRSYRSVCHGDLHLDNVLVIGKPGAEYPCIIDFEATHEGYILKDFGRFAAAILIRFQDWSVEDAAILKMAIPSLVIRGDEFTINDTSTTMKILVSGILNARSGILAAWRANLKPEPIEWVATMVASLLPYARYPDTSKANAILALELSDAFLADLPSGV